MASPQLADASYEYPWATSPDVLRAHQKDAYMTGTLSTQMTSILRDLLGARFAHKYHNASTHISELLYLCLTTLLGNRTLGEEYCDVVQVEEDTLKLASLVRRAGYIVSVVFSPWLLARILPGLRRRLRVKLERIVSQGQSKLSKQRELSGKDPSTPRLLRCQEFALTHLDAITSLSPIYAISLAAFYFTSSYYHLSKRLFQLRYIFTKRVAPGEQRVGYEVLGVLLVLQMAVQSTLFVRETFFSRSLQELSANVAENTAQPVQVGGGVEVSVNNNNATLGGFDSATSSSNLLLSDLDMSSMHHHHSTTIEKNTHTPLVEPGETSHFHLVDEEVMAWIPSGQQRKCTLCLEPFKDPSVTTCGHVFCWSCVQDWVREKPECPLCRSAIQGGKILPLRS